MEHASSLDYMLNAEQTVPATSSEANQEADIKGNNKWTAIHFKASHALLLVFFMWILCLHAIGIYFFTKGFLLTRLVLDHKSECASPPLEPHQHNSGSYLEGCWHPKTFDKAVIIIIDALRYDFTVPFYDDDPQYFHNALTVLYETAVHTPQNAFLLPFIADPPTTTLQRLKGLTTGTLPTFIDAGSNFAGTAIEEDNIVMQLRDAGKTLVHLGDDTWHSLFPGYFDPNLTRAYGSFNVWDLHTVDNGVTENILPLLEKPKNQQWDVIFGHFLGVDHAGHQYGPSHPIMASKLQQMDDVLRKIIASLDQDTLLVVMGDHGMDIKGDHGGESDEEVEAALWMYSKKGVFGRVTDSFIEPPRTAKERPVGQIDLVPSISLLLGIPIPFNNLGAPIAEAFKGSNSPGWRNLAGAYAVTAAQIERYRLEYSHARSLDAKLFAASLAQWNVAYQVWLTANESKGSFDIYESVASAFSTYQKETLGVFKSLWAIFNIPSMLQGVGILAGAVLVLAFYARAKTQHNIESVPFFLRYIGSTSTICAILGGFFIPSISETSLLDSCLLGLATGGLTGFTLAMNYLPKGLHFPMPQNVWGWLSLVFTVSQAVGFASNSYTIWEDEILLFFLCTFATVSISSSLRLLSVADKVLGVSQSLIFLILTRLASLSRLCREEQMPICKSTYHASSTSSTAATWHIIIPLALSAFLPSLVKSYYVWTRSYEGSAAFWIGYTFRMGLFVSAVLCTLDAAENHGWVSSGLWALKTLKTALAQFVLALAFAAGTTTFIWAKPCIKIELSSSSKVSNQGKPAKSLIVLGYANVHGTRYFLLVINWALAIILLHKPMGAGAVAILVVQILTLIEIIDTNNLSQSAVGPVILGLLGNYYFFKTGHQATLSSIQWESAFIPLKTVVYPWSPLFVILNTFGTQILTTVAVPLTVLWKQPPKKKGILADVARAVATNILYHAVINLATIMWAGWLRRHLMLYRIFSPRYLVGAAVLLIVDIVGTLVAIGSIRWNFLSVAEVFGWG